jgi:hypothetical protein
MFGPWFRFRVERSLLEDPRPAAIAAAMID